MERGRVEAHPRPLHLDADLVVPQRSRRSIALVAPEDRRSSGRAQRHVERIVDPAEAEALRGLGIPGHVGRHLVAEQQARAVAVRFRLVDLVVAVGEQAARLEGALFLEIVVAQRRPLP